MKYLKPRILLSVLVLLVGISIIASGSTNESDRQVINLGFLVPFSSGYSWVGDNVMAGIEAARNEVKGVTGEPFKITIGDTKGDPEVGLATAKKLVEEGVGAIVGPTSLTIEALIDYLKKEQLPTISPTAGTRELDRVGGEYIFRTVSSDSLGAYPIGLLNFKEFNQVNTYRDVGIIYTDVPAMSSFAAPLQGAIETLGLNLVVLKKVHPGKSSYRKTVREILDKAPGSLIFAMSNDHAVTFSTLAREMGFRGPLVFTQEQANDEFIKESGYELIDPAYSIIEGVPGYANVDQDKFSPQAQALLAGEAKAFILPAYDAAIILALAYEAAEEKTGPAIAEKVRAVSGPPGKIVHNFVDGYEALKDGREIDYNGIDSTCDFNDYGDTVTSYDILRAEKKRWETISSVSSAEVLSAKAGNLQPEGVPSFLFVQTAHGGTLSRTEGEDNYYTLLLNDVSPSIVFFSDRPDRIVGQEDTETFIETFDFSPSNPPNAAIEVLNAPEGADVLVVELFDPEYDPDNGSLKYRVKILEEPNHEFAVFNDHHDQRLPDSFGTVSLFIDSGIFDCYCDDPFCPVWCKW